MGDKHMNHEFRSTIHILVSLVAAAASVPVAAAQDVYPRAALWEKTIAQFEAWDAKNAFPADGVLFVGSSSIRMWPTRTQFPALPIINRGFGGSHIADVNHYADRIVLPYAPRVIVFYAGDNDVADGKTPQQVFDDYQAFVEIAHDKLPHTRIIFVSIKPSLSRWTLWPQMRDANDLIRRFSQNDASLLYADVAGPMLDDAGLPRKELFFDDGLHLNDEGYQVWTRILSAVLDEALGRSTAGATEPRLHSCQVTRAVTKTVSVRYLLYLPPDYQQDAARRWPLLLFLHGAGERGDDLDKVKIHGPPRYIAEGKDYPFVIVAPQCPAEQWWDIDAVLGLLDHVTETLRIDPGRVYLTGLSMGGFGTWQAAARSPERFAAIVPICGGGRVADALRLKAVPIWAFHGGQDTLVPPERSREMVAAVNEAGGSAKLTVYPDAGHDSWTETYENPELYEWLLSHERRSTDARP